MEDLLYTLAIFGVSGIFIWAMCSHSRKIEKAELAKKEAAEKRRLAGTGLPRRITHYSGPPSGHAIVNIDDTLPRDAREQLAEFVLALIGTGRYAGYLTNVHETATARTELPSISDVVSLMLQRNSVEPNQDAMMSEAHYDAVVALLANDADFFWLCVKITPLLIAFRKLCYITKDPNGFDIREDILPVTSTISTLGQLRDFFYTPTRMPDATM